MEINLSEGQLLFLSRMKTGYNTRLDRIKLMPVPY